ncbi:MAG: DNA repair protein RadA [Patescibacteria group bacterium]
MFYCTSCGNEFSKWNGQCPICFEWSTIKEIPNSSKKFKSKNSSKNFSEKLKNKKLDEYKTSDSVRISSGISELDRVFGGGITIGSVNLIAGEPGVGKSTLLLEVCANLNGVYFSAEESGHQVLDRAVRIGLDPTKIDFIQTNNLEQILEFLEAEKPKFIIIDSVQTISSNDIESLPGSVSQVKKTATEITNFCKIKNITSILVGHYTKEGDIAGPRILEHLVDAVFSFEGESRTDLRSLRSIKNRFGVIGEVGFFKFFGNRLVAVDNPSEFFIPSKFDETIGVATTAVLEGERVFLVEIEALAIPTQFGFPKRSAENFSQKRLELLTAVLATKGGIPEVLSHDIYIKPAGGFLVKDYSSDLAVCIAICSAIKKKTFSNKIFVSGEVSLSGNIFLPSQFEKRVKEADRLGFKTNFSKKENLFSFLKRNF